VKRWACYPRPNNVAVARTMCHAGTKSFIRAPVGTDPDTAAATLLSRNRNRSDGSCQRNRNRTDGRKFSKNRNMSDGRKLSIPTTSSTLAAKRGAPSTNLLAGLDAPLACAPSLGKLHRLATREERGTQDWRPRVHQAGQQGAVRPMDDSNT